ncbi:MAG: hypothetical protein RR140_03565 [Clostridia bacterium]
MKGISSFAKEAKFRLCGKKHENKCTCIISKIDPSQDAELCKKVRELVLQNSQVSNPLFLLCNNEEFLGMSQTEKQRYILELACKYRLYKSQIEEELLQENFV